METIPTAQPPPAPSSRWPVFLCYRQSDGRETADWLYSNLNDQPITENGQVLAALEVYQDRKAPAASDWRAIHLPAMQRARCFIIIITPGLYAGLGRNDWVHHELHWWLRNRRTAPVIIDATGEGERWIPEKVKKRWPNAQRIEIRLAEWSKLAFEEAAARKKTELGRILEGIRLNEGKIVFEELERFKRLALKLRTALAAAVVALLLALVFAWIALSNAKRADKAAENAKAQARTADSRRIAALSTVERDQRLDRALLLAAKAAQVEATSEARNALFKALHARPGLRSFLHMADWIQSAAFSSDGKTLAVGYLGHHGSGVAIWNLVTGRQLTNKAFPRTDGNIQSVSVSPEGNILAAGYSRDKQGGVALWDLVTQSRLLDVRAKGSVNGIAFSADGKILAACYNFSEGDEGDRGGILLWDGAKVTDILLKKGDVSSLAFSRDGKTLAVGCSGSDTGGGVALWNMGEHKWRTDEPLPVTEGSVRSVAFNPHGQSLAAGYMACNGGGGVVLWDANYQRLKESQSLLVKEVDDVRSVAFSPKGNILAAGYSRDNQGGVALWDLATQKRLPGEPLRVNEGQVVGVSFLDGRNLAAVYDAVYDAGVTLWDVTTPEPLTEEALPVKEGRVGSVAFSPDGKTMGASRAGDIAIWDTTTRQCLTRPLPGKRVLNAVFAPSGKMLAAGYEGDTGGRMLLWDIAPQLPVDESLLVMQEGVQSVAFNQSGDMIAVGYGHGSVDGSRVGGIVLWDAATRKRTYEFPVKAAEVTSVAFSPNGKMIAAGYNRNNGSGVALWNIETQERLLEEQLRFKDGFILSVAFSPDGKSLAAGYYSGDGGGVVIWDVTSGKPLTDEPLKAKSNVKTIAYSPDGKILAAGYSSVNEGGVKLWYVPACMPLTDDTFPIKGDISGMAYSPDGKTIAVGFNHSKKGGVVILDIDPESWIRRAGTIANRNFTREEWRQYFPGEEYRATFPELPVPPEVTKNNANGPASAKQGELKGNPK